MLRCKTVSNALAKSKYWKLPWYRRLGLHIHVALCVMCGRSNRQIMLMQDGVREYLRHEMEDTPPSDQRLPPEAREKLRRAIHS